MVCLAHGAKCVRAANGACDFGIRAGLAIRNPEKGLPTVFLELSSNHVERKREFMQLSAKVRFQLRNIRLKTF